MEALQTINKGLEKVEKRFVELTDKKTWEKEKAYAIQIFRKNAYLQKASLQSTLEALVNVANIGLSLNPAAKLAYLVPRFVAGGVEVCLEASYQGLVKLITDSGSAKSVYSHIVFEGDEFQEILGTNVELIHSPKRQSETPILVYAVAILHDGTKQVEVMSIKDIHDIRDKSEGYKSFINGKAKSCIWNDHFNEMARKTVIRRLCKYLPKTNQWDKINEAIKLDESDYKISDSQIDMIESLLLRANLPQEQKDIIESYYQNYTSTEANDTITLLINNQVDLVSGGFNYNQTDIKNKLNE